MMKRLFTAMAALALGLMAVPQVKAEEPGSPAMSEARKQEILKWLEGLKFQTGEVPIGSVAKAKVPEGYKYMGPADSTKYLNYLGNPPAPVLGILFPKDMELFGDDGWFVVLEYDKDGHVKDDDASKINYGELLSDMQKGTREHNTERVKQGYPSVELVGWAEPPHYDVSSHKLYWAQDLKFQGSQGEHSLNYNIRMLGREGVLIANAVGGIHDLPAIKAATPDILAMVDFTNGNRYQDYNEKTDHTAEYGIAGLIAGAAGLKVAAKLGIFALIAKKAAVLWKPIAVVFAAIATRFKKLFGRKGDSAA